MRFLFIDRISSCHAHVLELIRRFSICLGDHSQKGNDYQEPHNYCGLKGKKLILYERQFIQEEKVQIKLN